MSSQAEAERYRRAKAIAIEVLELPSAMRNEVLDERCGSDRGLREEVEWLLEAAVDDGADEVPEDFQATTREALASVSFEVPLPRNYRLIRRLGYGGMGIVYVAERIDGDLHQPVAFKLLHLDALDDDEKARRFATERGILSRLDHPGIARLIDGGVTADGRPFLATELVEGEPIDRWCARLDPPIDARVALFLQICEAVDHAHRHMVIHRDLKPSNILVTDQGKARLLDFGVASLLEGGQAAADEGMTLLWASPEQLRGEDLSAASDVYSLGVVLYQVLSGQHPFADIEDPATLRTRIEEGRAPSLRQVTGRAVSADLAAIVDKAMHRVPGQRFGSAREFADDLRRWREHRPVVAYRGGRGYRSGLFLRRHRWAMAGVFAAFFVVSAYLIERENQLDRIASERDRAESVTSFMNELLAGANSLPAHGGEISVRDVLDLGRRNLARSRESSGEVLGSIHLALGEAYNALGLGEIAAPLLEQARSSHLDDLPAADQARILAALGAAYDSAGRAFDAVAADEQALEAYAGADGDHERAIQRVNIRLLRNQANLLELPHEEVTGKLRDIVSRVESLPDPDRELLFEAYAALVGASVAARDAEAARSQAESALELSESQFAEDDPRRLRGRHLHATAIMLEDPRRAAQLFEALIADYERLVGPSQRLANTIGNHGVALSRLGRADEAMAAFERAAAMIEDTAGRDHYLFRLSISNLAALRLQAGDAARAERLIDELLPELERAHRRHGGVETVYFASALEVQGGAQVMQDRLPQAAESYRMALSSLRQSRIAEAAGVRERIAEKLAAVERRLTRI